MAAYKLKALIDCSPDSVWVVDTPSSIAKSAFFYVQEIGRFKTGPRYYTERENLDSYLIVFTLAGKGYLRYRGKDYMLSPYQAFFIDCREYQFYQTSETGPWGINWVHFNGATSASYYELFSKIGSPVVTLLPNTPVPSIIDQLIKLYQHKDARSELVGSQLLVQLLTNILLSTDRQGSFEFLIPEWVRKVTTHLDIHYRQRLSLGDLAKAFSLSKYHLVREFKKYTGLTPYEYLINTRINRAKQLLQHTNLSINEIAVEVGIENVSHFIQLFKKREGVTPLGFRKTWQWRVPN